MCQWFSAGGCDAVHTLDLPRQNPRQNKTPDVDITKFADQNERIVVTKDDDFVDSHLLLGRPARLLLISTGNISNDEPQALVVAHRDDMVAEFRSAAFVELGRGGLIVRG